jgi:hypothetical protein
MHDLLGVPNQTRPAAAAAAAAGTSARPHALKVISINNDDDYWQDDDQDEEVYVGAFAEKVVGVRYYSKFKTFGLFFHLIHDVRLNRDFTLLMVCTFYNILLISKYVLSTSLQRRHGRSW